MIDVHLVSADVFELDDFLIRFPHAAPHHGPQEGLAAGQHHLVGPEVLFSDAKGNVAQLLAFVEVLEHEKSRKQGKNLTVRTSSHNLWMSCLGGSVLSVVLALWEKKIEKVKIFAK